MAAAQIRIGISGWRYAPWRGGAFYPRDLPQRSELAFVARHFPTVELNGSFYSLQTAASYAAWRDATPAGFVFAVKGPRYLTHLLRLKDVEVPLANFYASGVLVLGDKLGPFLWQFPPQMRFDESRFDAFLSLLPRDTGSAATLARRHDDRVAADDGQFDAWDAPRRTLRHAVEIRHDSFRTPAFVALLRRHGVGLVVADTAGRWPLLEDLTADFVYLRLHGDEELYASGYGDAALDDWAARIDRWAHGGQPDDARLASDAAPQKLRSRDVYAYFDNDIKVHAPYDAAALARRLALPADLPRHPPDAAARAATPEPSPRRVRRPRAAASQSR